MDFYLDVHFDYGVFIVIGHLDLDVDYDLFLLYMDSFSVACFVYMHILKLSCIIVRSELLMSMLKYSLICMLVCTS